MRKAPLSVARRYARALLDVALDQGTADAVETALGESARLLDSQADLRQALTHPALAPEKKKKVAAQVWKSAPPVMLRLIELLVARDRVALLPAIHGAYLHLLNEHRGVIAAEAVSAEPLVDAQQKALAAAASKLAGKQVVLSSSVDPALLGGVVLRMDGRTYDGSLRAQLAALRARLAPAGISSSPRN
jgi:F-type H+-transporting ATPase subunit delta